MLRHKNKEKFEDFIRHWFLVIGYCLFLIYKQVQNRKAGKHLGCTGCGGSCGGCSGCSACRTEGNKKKH